MRHESLSRFLARAASRWLRGSPGFRLAKQVVPRGLRSWITRSLARGYEERERRSRALTDAARARAFLASRRETDAWQSVRTRSDWEAFRAPRLEALRNSLGTFPPPPVDLRVRVARTFQVGNCRIENLAFESRPGLVVTANLYRPAEPPDSMPGILVCHSHHNPKTQVELQEMGFEWARAGCTVLVMDQLGHGERRQHPFRDHRDYPRPFRVDRQDYFFRYNAGMQLHLVGESLIGWMVWDLMCGVDLLSSSSQVDPDRIVLIGSVAGGGDPAAVAAALDRRIAAVVPFGLGKARKEKTDPADSGTEHAFDFFSRGGWESTRSLRLSARDGFAPWLILGAVAPRRLIYAHEFAWDREGDPVWKRLRKIYALCEAPGHLTSLRGSGRVSGRSPTDTHCNNVGPVHRRQLHAALERWFGIPPPPQEPRVRLPPAELQCLSPRLVEELQPRALHRLAGKLGAARLASSRERLARLERSARRATLRQEYARLLGTLEPVSDPRVASRPVNRGDPMAVERITLEVEEGIEVAIRLFLPRREPSSRLPVVVGICQEGSQRLQQGRPDLLTELLRGRAAVCLADLRGTPEDRRGDEFRGRLSRATEISSDLMLLGDTLLGCRLRDLRTVLRYLSGRPELDASRVALWGDSFAPANAPGRCLTVPFEVEPFPDLCEPLGGMAALLGALLEENVRVVYLRGGLLSFTSLLESPFCYVPGDGIVPGALTVGDLCDVAGALAPRPLWMESLVDGLNRRVSAERLAESYRTTTAAYRAAGVPGQLSLKVGASRGSEIARWILSGLRTSPDLSLPHPSRT